jgi:hypothetical protein
MGYMNQTLREIYTIKIGICVFFNEDFNYSVKFAYYAYAYVLFVCVFVSLFLFVSSTKRVNVSRFTAEQEVKHSFAKLWFDHNLAIVLYKIQPTMPPGKDLQWIMVPNIVRVLAQALEHGLQCHPYQANP